MAAHSGPLPPPEMLAAYQRVSAGAAERILQMAEEEQKHRHQIAAADLKARITVAQRGQIFAFALGIVGTFGGIALALLDKSLAGFSVFLTSLATLAGIYFYRGKPKASEPPRLRK